MKRNNLFFSLMWVSLTLCSCTHHSYRMQTKINSDGSCTRTISIQTCDSAFITGDTTSNPLPIQLDSNWTLECFYEQQKLVWPLTNYKQFKTDTFPNLILVASRHFPSIEAMKQDFHFNRGWWSICKPVIAFQKKFRWFYTYYSYTETYPQFSILKEISLNDYLTPEEQILWFQGNNKVFQGKNGSELFDLLSKLEIKINLWVNHNLFAESYASIHRILPDHPFQNRFQQARDSIFHLNQDQYDALKSELPEMLDKYFKTNYFSEHSQQINNNDEPILQQKVDSLDLYGINFLYELNLPGKVISANTQQQDANKLIWQLDAYRFLPQDYIITAQSRKVNLWAFILTASLLILALYYLRFRDGPFRHS